MTTKKVQPRAARRNAATVDKPDSNAPTLNAEVALLLANVMAHPMLPKDLYEAIGEALTEMENNTPVGENEVQPCLTPEHIERYLNARDGLGHRAFGVFEKGKRPDGYAKFTLAGFDGKGRR